MDSTRKHDGSNEENGISDAVSLDQRDLVVATVPEISWPSTLVSNRGYGCMGGGYGQGVSIGDQPLQGAKA